MYVGSQDPVWPVWGLFFHELLCLFGLHLLLCYYHCTQYIVPFYWKAVDFIRKPSMTLCPQCWFQARVSLFCKFYLTCKHRDACCVFLWRGCGLMGFAFLCILKVYSNSPTTRKASISQFAYLHHRHSFQVCNVFSGGPCYSFCGRSLLSASDRCHVL